MRNFCVSFLSFKKRVYKGEKENTHSRVLSFFGKTGMPRSSGYGVNLLRYFLTYATTLYEPLFSYFDYRRNAIS